MKLGTKKKKLKSRSQIGKENRFSKVRRLHNMVRTMDVTQYIYRYSSVQGKDNTPNTCNQTL